MQFKSFRTVLSVWRNGGTFKLFVLLLFLASLTVLITQRMSLTRHLFPPSIPPLVLYYDNNGGLLSCSIPNACMRMHHSNRQLLVPQAYRPHEAILRRCQGYKNNPDYPNSLRTSLHFYDPISPESKLSTALDDVQDVDVLGGPFNNNFYAHFAHFAPDFAESAMVPASLFVETNKLNDELNTTQNKPILRPLCITPGAEKPTECDDNQLPKAPRFVMSSKTNRNGAWSNQLLRLISKGEQTVHMAPRVTPEMHTCFRSVLTSTVPFDVNNPVRDRVLLNSGIERNSGRPKCAQNIVVLSRKPHASRAIPRMLLTNLSTQLRAKLNANGLNATTVEFVQNIAHLGFKGQIALMQRADVLVTAHGAELSNAIFLRSGATVFEIYPFGWVLRNCFARILRAVHARRVELLSPPDTTRFDECMERQKRPDSEKAIFTQHVAKYYSARSEAERFETAPKFWELSREMGNCLAYQATVFDPEQLAQKIVDETALRCRS